MTEPAIPHGDPRTEALVFKPSEVYMVRVLTGQFDASSFDVDLAVKRLDEGDAKDAFKIMHDKWAVVRTEAYKNIPKTFEEKKARWAKGRAKAFKSIAETELSEELAKGLHVIGYRGSTSYQPDELEDYFSSTFYTEFAGAENKSVANLSNAFFVGEVGKDLTKEDIVRTMSQLKALKPVLAPILTDEIYEKLLHVTEAKMANRAKQLTIEDGQKILEPQTIEALKFFNGKPLDPVYPATFRPITPPLPVWGTWPAAAAPDSSPATPVVAIVDDEDATPIPPAFEPALTAPEPSTNQRIQTTIALTPELVDVLDKLAGAAVPTFVTTNLRRILIENGATSEELDNPGPLIEILKEKLTQQREQEIQTKDAVLDGTLDEQSVVGIPTPEPEPALIAPEPEPLVPPVTPTPEPDINPTNIPEFTLPPDVTPETLIASIKSIISGNQNVSRLNLAIPINVGKEYLISTFKSGNVKQILSSGEVQVTGEGEITVRGIQLRAGWGLINGNLNFNLILRNGSDGILIGKLDGFSGRWEDRATAMVANIQSTLEDKVGKSLKKDDPDFPWIGTEFTISSTGDNMLIGFSKIPSQTT